MIKLKIVSKDRIHPKTEDVDKPLKREIFFA